METFSALLAILVTGEFPTQRPVTRSFDAFFDLRLNKRLSKHRAHYDVTVMHCWLTILEVLGRNWWHWNVKITLWLRSGDYNYLPFRHWCLRKTAYIIQRKFPNALTKFQLALYHQWFVKNLPELVQIMAWRRPVDKPLSELMLFSLVTHICVTRHSVITLPCHGFVPNRHFTQPVTLPVTSEIGDIEIWKSRYD